MMLHSNMRFLDNVIASRWNLTLKIKIICCEKFFESLLWQGLVFLSLDHVNNVGNLQGWAQLHVHVLHHHVSVQQKQSVAINFVTPKELHVTCKTWVEMWQVADDLTYAPVLRVVGHCRWRRWRRWWWGWSSWRFELSLTGVRQQHRRLMLLLLLMMWRSLLLIIWIGKSAN